MWLIVDPMFDDHCKLTFTTSFIPKIVLGNCIYLVTNPLHRLSDLILRR